jgi:hypothetical protein
MRKTLIMLLALMLLLPTVNAMAKHRPHVVIHKRSYPPPHPAHPIALPIAVVPPLAVWYDFYRRTNCIGDPLGLGGPGFSEPMPVGNVMIPACDR